MQKAAALDPDGRAAVPGGEGAAAREARLDGAYCFAMNVLRFLCEPGAADTGGSAQVLLSVQLSPAERSRHLHDFLQV